MSRWTAAGVLGVAAIGLFVVPPVVRSHFPDTEDVSVLGLLPSGMERPSGAVWPVADGPEIAGGSIYGERQRSYVRFEDGDGWVLVSALKYSSALSAAWHVRFSLPQDYRRDHVPDAHRLPPLHVYPQSTVYAGSCVQQSCTLWAAQLRSGQYVLSVDAYLDDSTAMTKQVFERVAIEGLAKVPLLIGQRRAEGEGSVAGQREVLAVDRGVPVATPDPAT